MLRLAAEPGDRELEVLLRQQQRLADFYCFALTAQNGRFRVALGYAHIGSSVWALRQVRVAAGAARRCLAERAASVLGRVMAWR